jgi:hypothetical protein
VKWIWWIGIASIALHAVGLDLELIERKFEKVRSWRLSTEPDYPIYDPFKRAEPLLEEVKKAKPKPQRPTLRVVTIFNGKAFVNGRWVEAGDRIGYYRVLAVREGGIVVRIGEKTRFVPLVRSKLILKVKDKE